MTRHKPSEEHHSKKAHDSDAEPSSHEKKEPVHLSQEEFRQLKEKSEELDKLKDQLLRKAADFDNAKKRLSKERDEFVKFAKEALIANLLPVLDNMERALAHARQPAEEEGPMKGLLSGIEMVYKQLFETLKAQGLKRVEALGKTFDPHQHEAIAYVEEEGKSDEIVDEVEPGYMLHDKLLRAAKVRVRIVPSDRAGNKDSGQSQEKEEEIT